VTDITTHVSSWVEENEPSSLPGASDDCCRTRVTISLNSMALRYWLVLG
jgi:hypothetical protein